MEITDILGSREIEALKVAMAKKDMSDVAVIRHFFRLGQMADTMLAQGYEMVFRSPDNEEYNPLDAGPKMAPYTPPPIAPVTATDPACAVETCGHARSSHFSCEVGTFCKDCPSDDGQYGWTWEHVFKPIESKGWDSNEICRFHGGDGLPATCRECNRA